MNKIESMAFSLKLPNTRKNYKRIIESFLNEEFCYEKFLKRILQEDCNERKRLAINRKINNAKFPYLEL